MEATGIDAELEQAEKGRKETANIREKASKLAADGEAGMGRELERPGLGFGEGSRQGREGSRLGREGSRQGREGMFRCSPSVIE